MFYKLIERKRDEWLNSRDCVVADLISYIERRGKMRDAQIESIKTFLYLKIKCENLPLWKLVASGEFNTISIDELEDLEAKNSTINVLKSNPAALALWEYASIINEKGDENAPKIKEAIKIAPASIDYEAVIKSLFAGVDYPDYLFSIPMGAGKTYLMAAFIYLNLYFALLDSDNPLFAHNFMLFVPSGMKSSIVPSLRDIQNFDPLWILPDPVATQLKGMIKYEWLQEASADSKSTSVKNPNARKIAFHTSDPNLMGLVAVTNAEKVILNKSDNTLITDEVFLNTLSKAEQKEYQSEIIANELRKQIGEIPNLCVIIDEVHHASDDQKLRQVVNNWMKQSNFNSVLGFSGTPNMDPPAKITINDELLIKCTQYANVVTYYPLIKGIGNFLKAPTVRYGDFQPSEIISKGLQEFFGTYQDTVYSNGAPAKIAIYASSIEALEEEVYPEVCRVCNNLGIDAAEVVLKYHDGNKHYKADKDAKFEFSTLDSPLNKKRIVLLVGIGREGWNCKSLTGIILSQKNACRQNLVLQVSCRCLREVDNAKEETALIWLNKFNAEKLNRQLLQQQYITLAEFGNNNQPETKIIERYSRMDKLKLPPIEYYQIRIKYTTVEEEHIADIKSYLRNYDIPYLDELIIYTQDMDVDNVVSESSVAFGAGEIAIFREWLDLIVKESFGLININQLLDYEHELHSLFEKITTIEDTSRRYLSKYDQRKIRTDIRNCFASIRRFNVTELLEENSAPLLKENALTSPIVAGKNDIFYPDRKTVDEIMAPSISEEDMAAILVLRAKGINVDVPDDKMRQVYNRTYHYLPYHLDSTLEKSYMQSVIGHLGDLPGVEFYFNGDDTLTGFYIQCYTKRGKSWKNDGRYYPDFLFLTRNEDNSINKVIIVETKGEGYSAKFAPRRQFVENVFLKLNNDKAGYNKFEFLYIEDSEKKEARLQKTVNKIKSFLSN